LSLSFPWTLPRISERKTRKYISKFTFKPVSDQVTNNSSVFRNYSSL
jgi:hypothetical protein